MKSTEKVVSHIIAWTYHEVDSVYLHKYVECYVNIMRIVPLKIFKNSSGW